MSQTISPSSWIVPFYWRCGDSDAILLGLGGSRSDHFWSIQPRVSMDDRENKIYIGPSLIHDAYEE